SGPRDWKLRAPRSGPRSVSQQRSFLSDPAVSPAALFHLTWTSGARLQVSAPNLAQSAPGFPSVMEIADRTAPSGIIRLPAFTEMEIAARRAGRERRRCVRITARRSRGHGGPFGTPRRPRSVLEPVPCQGAE